jgi:hypothetical protein
MTVPNLGDILNGLEVMISKGAIKYPHPTAVE